MAKRSKKGSSVLGILLGIVVMLVIGAILFGVISSSSSKSDTSGSSGSTGDVGGGDPAETETWGEWIWGKLPDIPGVGEGE